MSEDAGRTNLIVVQDGYIFQHVHDCYPAQEGKKCRYKWKEHVATADGGTCLCVPHLDDRNVKLGKGKEVFVVHRGHE